MCEACRARSRTGDRAAPSPRSAFLRARKAEGQYVKLLRGVARQIGALCRGFDLEDAASHPALRAALDRYAHTLEPWAQSVGRRMVAEVAQRDASAWREVSALMGRNLRAEIANAPTGAVQRALQTEQVGLITSLPREAAERVHRLTQEGIVQGWRADRIAAGIMRTEQVARSRATLIAVTEVGRAASNITQARAQHVGSTSYIWRTLDDGDVRTDHRILNGKVFEWGDPPIADRRTGARAHPGCIYRCRCWAEVILPD